MAREGVVTIDVIKREKILRDPNESEAIKRVARLQSMMEQREVQLGRLRDKEINYHNTVTAMYKKRVNQEMALQQLANKRIRPTPTTTNLRDARVATYQMEDRRRQTEQLNRDIKNQNELIYDAKHKVDLLDRNTQELAKKRQRAAERERASIQEINRTRSDIKKQFQESTEEHLEYAGKQRDSGLPVPSRATRKQLEKERLAKIVSEGEKEQIEREQAYDASISRWKNVQTKQQQLFRTIGGRRKYVGPELAIPQRIGTAGGRINEAFRKMFRADEMTDEDITNLISAQHAPGPTGMIPSRILSIVNKGAIAEQLKQKVLRENSGIPARGGAELEAWIAQRVPGKSPFQMQDVIPPGYENANYMYKMKYDTRFFDVMNKMYPEKGNLPVSAPKEGVVETEISNRRADYYKNLNYMMDELRPMFGQQFVDAVQQLYSTESMEPLLRHTVDEFFGTKAALPEERQTAIDYFKEAGRVYPQDIGIKAHPEHAVWNVRKMISNVFGKRRAQEIMPLQYMTGAEGLHKDLTGNAKTPDVSPYDAYKDVAEANETWRSKNDIWREQIVSGIASMENFKFPEVGEFKPVVNAEYLAKTPINEMPWFVDLFGGKERVKKVVGERRNIPGFPTEESLKALDINEIYGGVTAPAEKPFKYGGTKSEIEKSILNWKTVGQTAIQMVHKVIDPLNLLAEQTKLRLSEQIENQSLIHDIPPTLFSTLPTKENPVIGTPLNKPGFPKYTRTREGEAGLGLGEGAGVRVRKPGELVSFDTLKEGVLEEMFDLWQESLSAARAKEGPKIEARSKNEAASRLELQHDIERMIDDIASVVGTEFQFSPEYQEIASQIHGIAFKDPVLGQRLYKKLNSFINIHKAARGKGVVGTSALENSLDEMVRAEPVNIGGGRIPGPEVDLETLPKKESLGEAIKRMNEEAKNKKVMSANQIIGLPGINAAINEYVGILQDNKLLSVETGDKGFVYRNTILEALRNSITKINTGTGVELRHTHPEGYGSSLSSTDAAKTKELTEMFSKVGVALDKYSVEAELGGVLRVTPKSYNAERVANTIEKMDGFVTLLSTMRPGELNVPTVMGAQDQILKAFGWNPERSNKWTNITQTAFAHPQNKSSQDLQTFVSGLVEQIKKIEQQSPIMMAATSPLEDRRLGKIKPKMDQSEMIKKATEMGIKTGHDIDASLINVGNMFEFMFEAASQGFQNKDYMEKFYDAYDKLNKPSPIYDDIKKYLGKNTVLITARPDLVKLHERAQLVGDEFGAAMTFVVNSTKEKAELIKALGLETYYDEDAIQARKLQKELTRIGATTRVVHPDYGVAEAAGQLPDLKGMIAKKNNKRYSIGKTVGREAKQLINPVSIAAVLGGIAGATFLPMPPALGGAFAGTLASYGASKISGYMKKRNDVMMRAPELDAILGAGVGSKKFERAKDALDQHNAAIADFFGREDEFVEAVSKHATDIAERFQEMNVPEVGEMALKAEDILPWKQMYREGGLGHIMVPEVQQAIRVGENVPRAQIVPSFVEKPIAGISMEQRQAIAEAAQSERWAQYQADIVNENAINKKGPKSPHAKLVKMVQDYVTKTSEENSIMDVEEVESLLKTWGKKLPPTHTLQDVIYKATAGMEARRPADFITKRINILAKANEIYEARTTGAPVGGPIAPEAPTKGQKMFGQEYKIRMVFTDANKFQEAVKTMSELPGWKKTEMGSSERYDLLGTKVAHVLQTSGYLKKGEDIGERIHQIRTTVAGIATDEGVVTERAQLDIGDKRLSIADKLRANAQWLDKLNWKLVRGQMALLGIAFSMMGAVRMVSSAWGAMQGSVSNLNKIFTDLGMAMAFGPRSARPFLTTMLGGANGLVSAWKQMTGYTATLNSMFAYLTFRILQDSRIIGAIDKLVVFLVEKLSDPEFIKNISGLIATIIEALPSVVDWVSRIIGILAGIANIPGMKELIGFMTSFGVAAQFLMVPLAVVGGLIQFLGWAVGGLAWALGFDLAAAWETITGLFTKGWLVELLTNAFTFASIALENLWVSLGLAVVDGATGVVTMTLTGTLAAVAAGLAIGFASVWVMMKLGLMKWLADCSGWFEEHANWFLGPLKVLLYPFGMIGAIVMDLLSGQADKIGIDIQVIFLKAAKAVADGLKWLTSFLPGAEKFFEGSSTNIQTRIDELMSQRGGGGFRGYAKGGSIKAGQPVIVGEEGPEVFVPSGSGSIIPNHMVGYAKGSGLLFNTTNPFADLPNSFTKISEASTNYQKGTGEFLTGTATVFDACYQINDAADKTAQSTAQYTQATNELTTDITNLVNNMGARISNRYIGGENIGYWDPNTGTYQNKSTRPVSGTPSAISTEALAAAQEKFRNAADVSQFPSNYIGRYDEIVAPVVAPLKTYGVKITSFMDEMTEETLAGYRQMQQSMMEDNLRSQHVYSEYNGKVPALASGGFISQTGLAVVHKGETITPEDETETRTVQITNYVTATVNNKVDEQYLQDILGRKYYSGAY